MHLTSSLLALASQNLSSSLQSVDGYSYCNQFYGSFPTRSRDCDEAIKLLDKGTIDVEYTINSGIGSHALPLSKHFGTCMIQIDIAGPRLPQTFSIPPDDIRHMASGVMNECVTGPSEIGGFATSDLEFLTFWITNPENKLEDPFPTGTAFLTVTISERVPEWYTPGDYDPIIPFHFSQLLQVAVERAFNLRDRVTLRQRANLFLRQSERMGARGGHVSWWEDLAVGKEANGTSLDTGVGTVSIELPKPLATDATTVTSKPRRRT